MKNITKLQARLVELDKQKEKIKAYYEDLKNVITELAELMGEDAYFKDEEGVVFKIVRSTGKYVSFDPFTYVRTKREGEARGTLSMKEAQLMLGENA